LKIRLSHILPVLLWMATGSPVWAPLSCNIASTPTSRVTSTGHTERAGDISFFCTASPTATGTTTVTVDYGVFITNSATYPASKPISIVGVSGGFATAVPTISSVNNSAGSISISLPAQASPADGGFTLAGVLVSLVDTGKTGLIANVSVGPGANVLVTAGQNTPTVITSVLPGLVNSSVTLTANTTAGAITSAGNVTKANWSMDISENYIDLFRSVGEFFGGASNATLLSLTFSGIPAGVTLGGCAVSATANNASSPGLPFIVGGVTTLTSNANVVTIDWAGDTNLQAIERVTFGCTTISVGLDTVLPLSPGSITAQANLAPIGTAFSNSFTVLDTPETGPIPRYALSVVPATPLVVVTLGPVFYTLSISKQGTGQGTVTSPAGINCGGQCGIAVLAGTQVTLTATANSSNPASQFVGWSHCGGTGTCTVTVDSPITVTAFFNSIQLTLSPPGVVLAAGSTLPLTLTGNNFVAGGTNVNVIGDGVTVVSSFVVNSTTISAVFKAAANATLGDRIITVSTSTQTSNGVILQVSTPDNVTKLINCGLATTPTSRATSTGRTEPVGDITVNCTYDSDAMALGTFMTISLGASITNSSTDPAARPIAITNLTGFFQNTVPFLNGVDQSNGNIQIFIQSVFPGITTGSFTITGPLVSLNGLGKTTLEAIGSLSPYTPFAFTSDTGTVISQILPGLTAPQISNADGGTATLYTNGTVADGSFAVSIAENYPDMFRSAAQFNSGASTNGTLLALSIITPTGILFEGCSVTATANGAPSPGLPFIVGNLTSGRFFTIDWAGPTDLSAVETVIFKCSNTLVGSNATLPLIASTPSLSATLVPGANAIPLVPRYFSSPGTVPVLSIVVAPDIPPSGPRRGQITSQE